NNIDVTKLREARHPFLMENATSLNFDIGTDYRTLVITGHNAGGKTIVLKSVGLFTLATMSGLHIPAKPDSEIAVYNQIYADIGDNQSIENALSTDRKSTRLNSSHVSISYAVFCLKKKDTLTLTNGCDE